MNRLDAATADAIADETYTYLFPLVLMELTRRQATNVAALGERPLRGPADAFVHVRAFPAADFRDVVRPNFDTLYSAAWLDLRSQPRIVSVPDAGDGYYLLPMYDMWSEVFASPGSRTTGGGAARFAVCPPRWDGPLPDGVQRIDAPTPWVWVIGRTRATPGEFAPVHAFQDGMTIVPLPDWPGDPDAPAPTGVVDPAVDDDTPPMRQALGLDAAGFFGLAGELLALHPPHFNDGPMLQRMARLGLVPGTPFDLTALEPAAAAALTRAATTAPRAISAYQTRLGEPKDGWITLDQGMGTWGTSYLRRACVALVGLGANLPEDAIYPISYTDGAGEPYTGERRYRLRFDAGARPPVDAFWSLTLYDAEGFQVANALDRFAIGDRDALRYGADGSLELAVQHEPPAEGTANWLPAPAGRFTLCLRLYHPAAAVLDGSWRPPAVRPV